MAIVLSGSTNDITVNGVSVATDAEVSSAVADAVQTGLVALQTIASGTATFTATTNNINLTGIGVGVEIGDVIQISGAEDTKNNSEFTVEVITDANNIRVNQAHANKGTSKNVATRVSDTWVTVKLLAKWYNATIGLGQNWVAVTRTHNTTYPNNLKRPIKLSRIITTQTPNVPAYSDIYTSASSAFAFVYSFSQVGNPIPTGNTTIPVGADYKIMDTNVSSAVTYELR